ncbi:hypothetical protein J3A72_001358 [Stenotrophomonas sp. PvP093]|uniref:DUF1631 family protein n=3 Tax=Pseudomonadati TaxID=3379134 RepID=UPI0007B20EC7|nr:DUF1631 family protein [Stenotrophomonas sp. PvP093]KZE54230.1 thymidine phosphorylase [Stenotrophomonas maltophilia]MBP2481066.1 hypothetical protein [Stenotrophomonas sp. PvP093]MCF3544184.1 DUF1631 family protein [Stenotrophomonas maltophilia]TNY00081.1 DUF1631 domain-containing protein [Stenotrophomonas maltophilia]TPD76208.1 DUF1631 domain-containing protein [Stenotrophomonas maltophilia]
MSAVFSITSADKARLAASDLPSRVRELLGALIGLCRQTLAAPLILTVEALEQTLLHDADRARNPMQQADLMAQRGQLHAFAGHFADRMLDAVAEALAGLREPSIAAAAPASPPPLPGALGLSLVDEHEVDRDLLLTEMIRRETLRSTNTLNLLGQRLGVLAAAPAFEADTLPLAPQALCAMVRRIAEQDALGVEVQLALYRSFERQVLERLGDVLDRANALLAQHGVLPGLVYTPYLARSSSTRRIITQSVGGGRTTQPAKRSAAPLTGWNGSAPAGSWSNLVQDAFNAAGTPGAATAGVTTSTGSALHELLQQARHATAPPADTAAVPSAAVDAVLARLQAQSSAATGVADLQAAVVAQLRSEHGAQAQLGSHDRDNLDLLRLLMQQVQQQQRPDPVPAALLARLQVPLARAAMADPGFFVRDEHPARELLNQIAEVGANWLGDDDVDPQLLQRMAQSVQGLLGQDARSPEAFAAANEDVQQHQRAAAHRAELAERRHVEAARGKERLELARRQANAQIDQCCDTQAPPRFVQTLLRQAWADALTLTRLRHGEDSPQWQERLLQTERIAAVTAQAVDANGGTDAVLANEVESALVQVGYHAEEAAAVARRLATPGGEDESTSRTELSARLKARARLGEHAASGSADAPRTPRSSAEEAAYQQLVTLPFGSWFDIDNGDGTLRRQRLSWYSLLTGHALFVNPRGQKIADTDLDTLARQLSAGRAQLVTEDKGRLVDRAWQASLGALRALAGGRYREASV